MLVTVYYCNESSSYVSDNGYPGQRMIVRVKTVVIGITAYLGAAGAAYYYTLTKAREARLQLEQMEGGEKKKAMRALTEAERLAKFDSWSKNYDEEIGMDETLMGLNLMRYWLISKSKGDTLEVAGGTGRNLG